MQLESNLTKEGNLMHNLPDIIVGTIFIILRIAGIVAMFFMDPAIERKERK